MSSSPTIRDIAVKLGLGKSTVQRALTGQGNISVAARDLVLATAKEIGYHPDPLFSSLARQRTRRRRDPLDIAYFHSPGAGAGIVSFPDVAKASESLGYRAHRITPAELDAGPRLMDVLYHRGHVGVIIGPVRASLHATILNNRKLPLVCCGRIDQLPLHTVQPDITDCVRATWKKVAAAGYRRIGPAICMHAPAIEDDLDRLGATLSCQRKLRPRDRIPPLETAHHDNASLLAWFHRYKPDAVIGFSVGQYYALQHAGVNMDHVGFASLHATNTADIDICGMGEANEQVARESVHMLDQLIRRRAVGIPEEPLHLLIPGRWHEGSTLRPQAPSRPRLNR